MIHPDKAVIIYDGCCLLCINFKNWVEKKALPDLIEFLPCQSEQLKVRYPHISRNACMQALHLVLNNNKTYAGADAFPYIAQRLKFWRHLYYMFKP